MKPLRIFTPVFGKRHIDLLSRALGRSLLWPKNFETIKDAKWILFIHKNEFEQVMGIATKVLPSHQIETIEFDGSLEELTKARGILMCQAFAKTIRGCIRENTRLLVSTADFIWADGTLANMLTLSEQTNTCVSLPHPRVLPSILDHIDSSKNSFDLVTLMMKHPHRSWVNSEYGKHFATYKGGILWRRSGAGVLALQHRMPSPYMLNFTKDDIDYFTASNDNKIAAWGAIDHDWASHLCETQRWRMILSSDIGFMAEVTSENDNLPPQSPCDMKNPDDFWTQDRTTHLLHHRLNRQFIATFRGDF